MIALAAIAYNNPRVVREQIRLLKKYLDDTFWLIVFDSSRAFSEEIEKVCREGTVEYRRLETHAHHEALNQAAQVLLEDDADYIGFLDHDVFPIKHTCIIPLIEEAGFYGIGQRHPATGHLYIWPGFCFFSREWLNGRPLDFSGLRDGDKRNDGDTGSALWPLFENEEWEKLYRAEHLYRVIRKPDEYGLQSWGYEVLGDWIHFSNASNWMWIPKPKEREKLLFDLLAEL